MANEFNNQFNELKNGIINLLTGFQVSTSLYCYCIFNICFYLKLTMNLNSDVSYIKF